MDEPGCRRLECLVARCLSVRDRWGYDFVEISYEMQPLLDELDAISGEPLTGGDLDSALAALIRFVSNVNALPATAGAVLESRDLDAACGRCGEAIPPGASGPATMSGER